MSTLQLRSSGSARVAPVPGLEVSQADIAFGNETAERVGIAVTIVNDGDEPSAPDVALVSGAVLGAFLPWKPLATLTVPRLEPGGQVVLRTEGRCARPAPLGPPNSVRPRDLLTAVAAPDPRPNRAQAPVQGPLPADPLALLCHGGVHWAGNLNIFVGGKSVERHLAQALRIYPGRTNLALFFAGSRRDAYRFRLAGDGASWQASVGDLTDARTLFEEGRPVDPEKWLEAMGTRIFALVLRPPEGALAGTVEVHVTRRSSCKNAVVEFALDARAAGPGCYVV